MGPTKKWVWREHHCHALGDEIQRVPSPASPSLFNKQHRDVGIAHLAAAITSFEKGEAHDRGNVVFGGFLQPPSNGFSSDRWALITALTP